LDFSDGYQPTVGGGLVRQTVEYKGVPVDLRMADTAGHEKFSALTPNLCRNKDCCLLVYSIDKPESLGHVPMWRDIIVEQSPLARLFVVGTKVDLADSLGGEAVSRLSGRMQAQDIGAVFLETSAKTTEGINVLREMMCGAVVDERPAEQKTQTQLHLREPSTKGSDCCP
jgi:small GTP-binding protein